MDAENSSRVVASGVYRDLPTVGLQEENRVNTDEQLQEKLARISGRMQSEQDRVRRALQSDPVLLQVAELCKQTFQSRFVYLKVGGYEKGRDWPKGIVPAKYNKPPKGKGHVAWLRKLEVETDAGE
jgi:hypothetical protein